MRMMVVQCAVRSARPMVFGKRMASLQKVGVPLPSFIRRKSANSPVERRSIVSAASFTAFDGLSSEYVIRLHPD